MIVGIAAGFVLANIIQRVQHDALESPEDLVDSLDSKLKELEGSLALAD